MLDATLFEYLFRIAHKNAFVDSLVIISAVYVPYILLAGFLILLWKEKRVRVRIFFACEALLAVIVSRGIVTEAIRFFFNRERPFEVLELVQLVPHSAGGAFPSGHMALFAALAVAVWYVNRKWGVWYGSLVLLIGLARIIAGIHWPIDVLGGIAIGILSAMAVHKSITVYGQKIRSL